MSDLEKEFIASFKALLKRYNVKVEKRMHLSYCDTEVEWTFMGDAREDECVDLTMDDIHIELVK